MINTNLCEKETSLQYQGVFNVFSIVPISMEKYLNLKIIIFDCYNHKFHGTIFLFFFSQLHILPTLENDKEIKVKNNLMLKSK